MGGADTALAIKHLPSAAKIPQPFCRHALLPLDTHDESSDGPSLSSLASAPKSLDHSTHSCNPGIFPRLGRARVTRESGEDQLTEERRTKPRKVARSRKRSVCLFGGRTGASLPPSMLRPRASDSRPRAGVLCLRCVRARECVSACRSRARAGLCFVQCFPNPSLARPLILGRRLSLSRCTHPSSLPLSPTDGHRMNARQHERVHSLSVTATPILKVRKEQRRRGGGGDL